MQARMIEPIPILDMVLQQYPTGAVLNELRDLSPAGVQGICEAGQRALLAALNDPLVQRYPRHPTYLARLLKQVILAAENEDPEGPLDELTELMMRKASGAQASSSSLAGLTAAELAALPGPLPLREGWSFKTYRYQ